MPITNQTLNNNLYDNLYAQGYNPDPLDSMGKESEITDADVFKIYFTDSEGKEGNAWLAVLDGQLVLWADNKFINLPKFENFNSFWKTWAQKQTLRWEVTNRDRLVSDMKKRTAMKKKEDQLNEGYHALGKQRSYSDSIPTVKLIIQHTRQLEEGEQRFRNIAKIFVENAGGERFLLPTNRPGLARIFARHIAEGGTPYDDKGRHITTLVEEYTSMAGFVRATRNGQFNESALRLVNEGLMHYNNLRMTLQGLTSHRGYNKYFESYTPVLNEEADDDTSLNELFVEETLDPRIESVMPILKRLSKNITEMNEVQELDEWASSIIENDIDSAMNDVANAGSNIEADAEKAVTDAENDVLKEKEDETTKTLAEPAIDELGEAPGAMTLKHNQNTEKSNLNAFDLAEDDMEEDVKDVMKSVRKKFRQSAVGRAREHGYSIEEGFSPSSEVADQIIDSLGSEKNLNSDDIYRAIDEFQLMMDDPYKLDTDEVAQIVMDRLNITNDDIDEELENEVLDTVSDDLMGDIDEGVVDTLKKVGKKVADYIAPGDEELLKDLQKKAGIPTHAQHGKPRMAVPKDEVSEADMDEGIVGNMINKAKGMFKKPAAPAVPAVAPVAAKAAPGMVKKGGTMDMTKKVVAPAAKPAAAPAVGAGEDFSPQEIAQMNKDLVAMDPKSLAQAAARTDLGPTVTAAVKAEVARRKTAPAVAEDLDANQKRVGQLGPTEKVKNNNIGKLVGANESVEFKEGQEDLDAILRIVRR